jgi:hypothetical protein
LNERTLERVDVKALVVPVESFFSECFFKLAPLRVVWGDDLVRNALLFFEVFRDEHDGFDLLLILMMRLAPTSLKQLLLHSLYG